MNREEKLKMLQKLDEKRLTKEILIPLFVEMGLENVRYTHGVLECGRDIIYCEKTKFLKHRYVGIQVKSGDIDTKVAEKLFAQVTRGVGESFIDLSDTKKEKSIDEFIVLCSGEIKENARENISSLLKGVHVDKPISFIEGLDIVTLLDEYMPSDFWNEYDYFTRYFNAMRADFETIADVSAIGQREPVRLENIYVSLRLTEEAKEREIQPEHEWKIFDEKLSEREKEQIDRLEDRTKVLDAQKAAEDYNRLVIVGAPGSGKTTLLKYLALKMCRQNLEKQERISVPIPVTLRELVESGKKLRPHIDQVFEKYDFPKAKSFVEKDLKEGRCRILLDGFDELATRENQHKVAEHIEGFIKKYPRMRIVVTSRIAGYHDELKGFKKVELMEFNDKQIEKFIENWFVKRDPDRAHSMFNAIKDNERIKALARNPLMIAIIAVIYEEDRELPQRRADLYERCVEVLLSRWDVQKRLKNKYSSDKKEFILRKLAFYGHSNNKRVMSEDEVMDQMLKHFPQIGLQERQAKGFLNEIWHRSYLLRQISMDSYDFLHLSFQEYFAALELRESEDGLSTIIENLDKPWWQEPILLYAGISRDASGLIKNIEEKVQEDIFHSNLVLFGKCVVYAEFTDVSLKKSIVKQLWSLYQTGEFKLLRDRAMEVLRLIKPDDIIESLIKDLRQAGESSIRRCAAEVLGRIASEKSVEPLTEALATDKESDVRWRAADALGLIASEKAIEPLTEALATDKESDVRSNAADALGRIASEKAIEPLTEALAADKDSYVRGCAAEVLGHIASEESIEPLIEAIAADEDRYVRSSAAEALGLVASEKDIDPLTEALATDKKRSARSIAAYALGLIAGEMVIDPLTIALATDKKSSVQSPAAYALGFLTSEKDIGPLTEALATDKESSVRSSAARALGGIASEKAIEPLTEALTTDKESSVRSSAAYALGSIASEKAIEPLTEAMATDNESSVRLRAARALGCIASEKAIGPLTEALATDKKSDVREHAAYALGLIASEKSIEPLTEALANSKESYVRLRAAEALGLIASEKAIKPLRKALLDEGDCYGGKVKDGAFKSLEKIRNRMLKEGASREQWIK